MEESSRLAWHTTLLRWSPLTGTEGSIPSASAKKSPDQPHFRSAGVPFVKSLGRFLFPNRRSRRVRLCVARKHRIRVRFPVSGDGEIVSLRLVAPDDPRLRYGACESYLSPTWVSASIDQATRKSTDNRPPSARRTTPDLVFKT